MSYLNGIKNAVGRKVTLKVVDDGSVTKWGDQINETITEESITCVIDPEGREVEEGTEGDFSNEQIRAFFDLSDDNIEEGNIIVVDDRDYRIDEVVKYELGNKGGHYETRASVI